MRSFVITEDNLNSILSYLGSRPYVEVSNIISYLKGIPEFVQAPRDHDPEVKSEPEISIDTSEASEQESPKEEPLTPDPE